MQQLPNELNYRLALQLPFDETINYCKTNSELAEICRDENFWRKKALFKHKTPLPKSSAIKQYHKLERKNIELLPEITSAHTELLYVLLPYYWDIDAQRLIDKNEITDILLRYPDYFSTVTDSKNVDDIIEGILNKFEQPLIDSRLLILKIKGNFIIEQNTITPPLTQKIVLRKPYEYLTPFNIFREFFEHINYAPTDFNIYPGGYESGIPIIKFSIGRNVMEPW